MSHLETDILSRVHRGGGGTPRFGVVLRLHVSDRFYGTEIQIAVAATSDATVPLTSTAVRLALKEAGVSKHTDFLPNDNTARHYRARHVADGFDAGTFSDFVCAKPVILGVGADGGPSGDVGGGPGIGDPGDDPTAFEAPFWSEARRRGDTFYDDDSRLKKIVKVRDGSGDFELNRHNESGLAQHTDAVTFSADFEAPPRITFVPQQAKIYSNSSDLGSTALGSTAGQFINLAAESLTVAGFTLRALLASSGSVTSINDGWSTAQNSTAPENGDVELQSDGAVAFSNLEDADGSAAATYRAFFDVDAGVMNAANTLTVQLAFNSASTSTSFTLGASRNYASGVLSTDEELSVITTLGSSYDLRLRISYSSDPGVEVATVTAHGEDNGQPGVQFDQVTGAIEESMTPSTGQKILWQATETP